MMVFSAPVPGWVTAVSEGDVVAQIVGGVAIVLIVAMLGFILKAALWLSAQMRANGKSKEVGTSDKTFRETLDKIKGDLDDNTRDTQALATLTENVRRQVELRTELIELRTEERHQENVAALTEMGDGFKSHLAWSDEVVIEIKEMILKLDLRVSALEARHDERMPRLEAEDEG